jgi:hypothetical protein
MIEIRFDKTKDEVALLIWFLVDHSVHFTKTRQGMFVKCSRNIYTNGSLYYILFALMYPALVGTGLELIRSRACVASGGVIESEWRKLSKVFPRKFEEQVENITQAYHCSIH